jgi:hypothetical protein
MGVFDQASRYTVKAEPAAFFAWRLPRWVAHFDFAGWADYGGLALVFAELAKRLPIWKQALEGWNVQQSQQVLEWQREARTDQLREDIRRGIQARYRSELPDDLEAALARLADLDELNRWFDAMLTADTLDAFRAAVGPGTAPVQGPSGDNGETPEDPQA